MPPQTDFTDGPASDQRTGEDEDYLLSPGYEHEDEPGHSAEIYDTEAELVWIQSVDGEGHDRFFTPAHGGTRTSLC